MKRLRLLLRVTAATASVLLLIGCEQLFSTNVFSGLERDPSKLSFEQQIVYARNAVASGDRKIQAKAYDALAKSLADKNNQDPELNSLAINLAIGASGMADLLTDFLTLLYDGSFSSSADAAASLDGKLSTLDYAYIDSAAAQIAAMKANGGTPSEQQYLLALTGLVMKAGAAAGGIESIADWSEVDALLGDAQADYPASDYVDQFDDLTP